MDEDEEEGRERLEGIVIVIGLAFVVRDKSLPRVGTHALPMSPSSSSSTRMGRPTTPSFASGSRRVHYSYIYSVGG